MGWAHCGTDSKGREIGYGIHEGVTCDHPGCTAEIDRGLGYACGGMHGERDSYCEGYFCGAHLVHRYDPNEDRGQQFCGKCAEQLDDSKCEEFMELLGDSLTELPDDADAQAFKDAIFKFKKQAFDLFVRWDELDHLTADERFLTPKDLEQVRRCVQINADYQQARVDADS